MGRRAKGEGSLYSTIQKIDRKQNRKKEMCNICKNCSDRTICNNRKGTSKCAICRECTDCLSYCDRFYCHKIYVAQATVNGQKKTLDSGKKQTDVKKEKNKQLAKIETGLYVDKSNLTLVDLLKSMEKKKLDNNEVTENAYNRNMSVVSFIENSEIGKIKIQKIKKQQLDNLMQSAIPYSQSSIEKIYDELVAGFREAEVVLHILDFNPMKEVKITTSTQTKKVAIPFTIQEEIKLINYITTHNLITDTKSKYDTITIKNIILLGLLTGMRIGEMGALLFTSEYINFEEEHIWVGKTLTKNKENKTVIGIITKGGKRRIRNQEATFRIVPFGIFDKDSETVKNILTEQLEVAKNNKNNTEQLLFCKKDGSYINHSQVTSIFKRICKEAGIKLDLPTGCHIHMTKHTAVTRMFESGMRIETIGNLVGTTPRILEKTYAHILKTFIDDELKGLNQYYKNKEIQILDNCIKQIQFSA